MEKQNNQPAQKSSKNTWIIINIALAIIILLLLLIIAGGLIFYFWQKSETKSATNINTQLVQELLNKNTNQNENININKNVNKNKNINKTQVEYSETISVDETWNKYTNNELGFSINFPKSTVFYYASCKLVDDSYRPEQATVPNKIFEDKIADKVYIANEYYNELTGETQQSDGSTNFSGCEKINNSLLLLKDQHNYYQQSWEIVVKEIKSDSELDTFIKDRYGKGCSVGEKQSTDQEGVYDVSIQGDGKDLGETDCPINYMTILKYHPEKNKVISWHTGQAVTFWGDADYTIDYDNQMTDSFKFE